MDRTRGQFERLLADHCCQSGFTAPPELIQYLVTLLNSRLHRVDVIPDPSFAERYLQLYISARPAEFVDFADSALFFCSLLPEYGQRRGLNMDYYATLGISTYYAVGDMVGDDRYVQLGNWFYQLQRFLHSAIRPEVRLSLVRFD